MPRRTALIRFSLAAAAAVSLAWPAGARAGEPPSAIIVFDGSGSIWGELGAERRSKFDIAREALKASLARSARESRLGLLAFGHRRKGDCNDVELVVPPDAGPPERMAPRSTNSIRRAKDRCACHARSFQGFGSGRRSGEHCCPPRRSRQLRPGSLSRRERPCQVKPSTAYPFDRPRTRKSRCAKAELRASPHGWQDVRGQ